jgi:hypothetical protein
VAEAGWYEVVRGEVLIQGDILTACPVFLVIGHLAWPLADASEIAIEAREVDLIVLTQSCDLENEKVEDVLLAQVIAWPDAVRAEVARGNEVIRSSRFRRQLVDGNVPGYSLLHRHDGEPRLDWSVVDFHRLHTLPKAFLMQRAAQAGSRLRVLSPYREHLAQAFARYFMRVGLPHDARSFITEGGAEL